MQRASALRANAAALRVSHVDAIHQVDVLGVGVHRTHQSLGMLDPRGAQQPAG